MQILSRIKRRLAYRFLPQIVDFGIHCSSIYARQRLIQSGALRILVDVNVMGYGTTHVTRRIDTGTSLFNGVPFTSFYTARVPKYDENTDSRVLRCVSRLPAIAHLSKLGLLELLKSKELQSEVNRQPSGRFYGYGYYDYNVFKGVEVTSVDGSPMEDLTRLHDQTISHQERQLQRVHSSNDTLYREIAAQLDPKDSLDAWHIRTAELFDCYCFLTMDFKLRDKVDKRSHREPFKSLRTKVLTPEDLAHELRIPPVSLRLLSYHSASFPVRDDLHAG